MGEHADWTSFEFAKANSDLNKSYFDRGIYNTFPSYFKLKEAISFILEKEQGNLTLLDIGCGTGWQAEYLRREGLLERISYTGSDVSVHMCDLAKQNCPVANFMVSNIMTETLGPFDIVMEAGVIELFDDWAFFATNMMKCCKKWLVLHRLFFTEQDTYLEQTISYNDVPEIRMHVNVLELEDLLVKNGFAIVKNDIWHTGSYNESTLVAYKGGI